MHGEERALWHTERADLLEKIRQLEGSLRRYQAISSSETISPIDPSHSRGNGSFRGMSNMDVSRHPSTALTGDEVWRGPKTDVEPTRTFSDVTNQPAKPDPRLPSIAEVPSSVGRRKLSQDIPSGQRKSSVVGTQIDKKFDGINFKSSNLPPSIVKEVMTPPTASPKSPSSPSPTLQGTMPLPSARLRALNEDPYTKDAGHTPLARHGYLNDGTSDISTPIQGDGRSEKERPPLEPRTTSTKQPSERSDSYFPVPPDDPQGDDPALSKPLSLSNNEPEDNKFLSELNNKLLQATSSEVSPTPAAAHALGNKDTGGDEHAESNGFEQPEDGPRLKIKRSMNFGSAFGSKNIGKDA